MFLKIDMDKAYDRVEWDFLECVLHYFGFNHIWINWVMLCVRSASFNVLINGSIVGYITPSRVLIQGDPMSPYLFILCTEILTRLLLRSSRQGKLKGALMSRQSLEITHVLFADDLILCGRATKKVAKEISDCLRTYCQWSGQQVNAAKLPINFSKNTPRTKAISVNPILGFQCIHEFTKHLGLPLFSSNKRTKDWQFIVERVQVKISRWKSKLLSKAGRLTLISSMGQAMPIYGMTTALYPMTICFSIDSLSAGFGGVLNLMAKLDLLCELGMTSVLLKAQVALVFLEWLI